MRAKQFTRKVNEAFGDGDVANAVVAEVIKLIGEGHTEVSPDVITTKVSAALGRPFMLKDLVAANNGSPELQHYIDTINPSKIKFSTDILTVKNQDPAKDKAKAQSGVASMASRAASRPRLGESTEGAKYGVYRRGGSLGSRGGLIKTFDTKEEAQEYAKRQRKHLTPGERSYYKMGYNVKPVKPGEQIDEGWGSGSDRVSLPDEPSTYWAGKGQLQKEYDALYNELVPGMGAADTIQGEVLRAASKIVYRHYNDGDEFNQASFDQLEPYIGKVTSYDDLAHKATEFALKANGNYTPNPDWDSLDVMEYGPEEDDYDDEEDDDYDDWSDDVDDEEEDDEDLDEDYDVDEYEDEDDEQGFFVALGSEDDGSFIGMVSKDGGKWRETRVSGNAPYNWGGTYMGYLTPDDVMQWIRKDYRNYDVEGPFDSEEEAREHAEIHYGLDESDKEEFKSTYKKYYDKVKKQKEQTKEGWESGPEERAPRERDPDAEYDARRQEKMDIEAEKAQAQRPQEKYYTLVGRGPNMEPNYEFPGEYASQDEAVAARAKLMADPKTPNPRDIGISKRTRYLDEGRETPLRDLEDYKAKKKALQDIQSDPSTSQDPELSTEVIRRLAGLKQQAKAMGLEESRKK